MKEAAGLSRNTQALALSSSLPSRRSGMVRLRRSYSSRSFSPSAPGVGTEAGASLTPRLAHEKIHLPELNSDLYSRTTRHLRLTRRIYRCSTLAQRRLGSISSFGNSPKKCWGLGVYNLKNSNFMHK